MKRKHAEMIKAWADDDSLVCFAKLGESWTNALHPSWDSGCEYFPCLPQHKEACLAWLNGGELIVDNGKGNGESEYTLNVIDHPDAWTDFLRDDYKFRIKPKKEKLWIAVSVDDGWTSRAYKTRDEVVKIFGGGGVCQVVEVEVEV